MEIEEWEIPVDPDWTEKFICAVQSRPPIYNPKLPEHSDRNLVSRLWEETLEEISPNFKNMSANEKHNKVKELQGKWKNLRTCFRRELGKQKKSSSGQAATKRRKYVYFDLLSFLLPTIEDRPTVSECEPPVLENGESGDELGALNNDANYSYTPSQIENAGAGNSKRTEKKKSASYEESLLSILKEKKDDGNKVDEDRSFLLSLLPSLKKLSDVRKIDIKMEFLASIKRHLRCSDSVSSHQSSTSRYVNRPSYSHRSTSHHRRYDFDDRLHTGSPQSRRHSRPESISSEDEVHFL